LLPGGNCVNKAIYSYSEYRVGVSNPAGPSVPARVGPDATQKILNTPVLQAYIKTANPFWKPGSLTEMESDR